MLKWCCAAVLPTPVEDKNNGNIFIFIIRIQRKQYSHVFSIEHRFVRDIWMLLMFRWFVSDKQATPTKTRIFLSAFALCCVLLLLYIKNRYAQRTCVWPFIVLRWVFGVVLRISQIIQMMRGLSIFNKEKLLFFQSTKTNWDQWAFITLIHLFDVQRNIFLLNFGISLQPKNCCRLWTVSGHTNDPELCVDFSPPSVIRRRKKTTVRYKWTTTASVNANKISIMSKYKQSN